MSWLEFHQQILCKSAKLNAERKDFNTAYSRMHHKRKKEKKFVIQSIVKLKTPNKLLQRRTKFKTFKLKTKCTQTQKDSYND